ncbi:alpha-glucan family phosphorylase [Hydrogenothermus marinus]|uniref:glycogen phosphorylase n=1 Tax=Hydrogenothermus marinus TaxID=133270 RepID=A0A3M0BKE2_9AQUI|nr:alpha-glucan family phosphorylase [Hydrogenothermus marinus]RMA97701.1 starch phosphorylase [Hydrogenothermus marinus]
MNKDPSANIIIPSLPEEIKGLSEIALNLWWTWNPRGENLFRILNPYLWKESENNPIAVLKNLPKEYLESLTKDENFMKEYKYVYALFKDYMNDTNIYAKEKPLPIAYFCAEFGLHHTIPIYSGGLGILAGDILKESSDMNIPIVGIGFMYPHGYVKQVIGSDGWQHGTKEELQKDLAPIERVLDKNGNHFIIQVPFIDPPVYAAIWKVNVGKVSLYLLDTDIEQNDPWDREISYRLYTPDLQQRLRQQIVLGIGGYKVLKELGIEYSILHLNEGHPAFAIFERIRNFVEDENLTLDEAIEKVKRSSIFTTHTPLQAATDVYSFDMMSKYFQDYWQHLGMTKEQFLSFGINPDDPSGFNMTVFALRMCNYRNAVSKKHCETTKKIWKHVFEKENEKDVPVDYVTNGVHIPTWLDEELYDIYEEILGDRWLILQDNPDIWEKILDIDDKKLWEIKYKNKVRMINFIREKARKKWANEEADPSVIIAEGVMLDPDILTIGFARRMTSYKRPDLILYDLERLEKIINNESKPVQIIFAGKAHPADIPGKKIIQKIFKIAQDPKFKGRIVFIEDYGKLVARYLVKGVDLWLNTPKPPLEACGTSGMKASMNGVLHLSSNDGWWVEGYNGKNGWVFGQEPADDSKDAEELYNLLENEVIPLYYDRNSDGIPYKWIRKMKEAMISVSPRFSARRMMKDYLEKFYIPITKEITKKD